MIAAARLPLRNGPAKSQFLRPSGHGLIWLSASQTRLPESNFLALTAEQEIDGAIVRLPTLRERPAL